MSSDRRPWRGVRRVVVFVILDVLLSVGYIATSYVVVAANEDGQAIAVLWGDQNEIGAETERRIEHAISIWNTGDPTRLIFCIGGARPRRGYFGAQVLSERLMAGGIPGGVIRIGSGSNDTVSNLAEIAEAAQLAGVQRIVVVSDQLLAMRAELFLRPRNGLIISWSPYDWRTARPTSGFLQLWLRVHYEWLAVASLLLPEDLRRGLLNSIRK